MGTRSGSIDPDVLLHLMHEEYMDEAALSDLLYKSCGLPGVSGIKGGTQELLNSSERAAAGAVSMPWSLPAPSASMRR